MALKKIYFKRYIYQNDNDSSFIYVNIYQNYCIHCCTYSFSSYYLKYNVLFIKWCNYKFIDSISSHKTTLPFHIISLFMLSVKGAVAKIKDLPPLTWGTKAANVTRTDKRVSETESERAKPLHPYVCFQRPH